MINHKFVLRNNDKVKVRNVRKPIDLKWYLIQTTNKYELATI